MKTLTKLAKAEQMQAAGYELGDFTLEFIGFNCTNYVEKSAKRKDIVYAQFEVYGKNQKGETVRECCISYEMFSFGFVTPKGYKSTKVVPVTVKDIDNLSKEDILKLLQYKADYKINTFDPFYYENEAKRRNAAGWNYVAANFITDPYCTR
jgi:hypothetical protein